MTRKFLGCFTGDGMLWSLTGNPGNAPGFDTGTDVDFPPITTNNVNRGSIPVLDADAGDDVADSRGSFGVKTTHGNLVGMTTYDNAFKARTKDYINYEIKARFKFIPGGSGSQSFLWLTSVYLASGGSQGQVAIEIEVNNTSGVRARVALKTGGAWTTAETSGNFGAWVTWLDTVHHVWALQVDLSSTPIVARITKDGAVYSAGTNGWSDKSGILAAQVKGTPSPNLAKTSGKGTSYVQVNHDWLAVFEGDNIQPDLSTASATKGGGYDVFGPSIAVMSLYPTGDASSPDDDWANYGGISGCVADKYRDVDDAEDDGDQANDRIIGLAGEDQLFTFDALPTSPAATVEGVTINAVGDYSKGLAKRGVDYMEETTQWNYLDTIRTAVFQTGPGTTLGWSKALFDATDFGVRDAGTVYGMIVDVYGTNLTRRSGAAKKTVCPFPDKTRRMQQVSQPIPIHQLGW